MISPINSSTLGFEYVARQPVKQNEVNEKPIKGSQNTVIQNETPKTNLFSNLNYDIPGEFHCNNIYSTGIGWLQINQHVNERMGLPSDTWLTLDNVTSALRYAKEGLAYINSSDYPLLNTEKERETAFFEAFIKHLNNGIPLDECILKEQ